MFAVTVDFITGSSKSRISKIPFIDFCNANQSFSYKNDPSITFGS